MLNAREDVGAPPTPGPVGRRSSPRAPIADLQKNAHSERTGEIGAHFSLQLDTETLFRQRRVTRYRASVVQAAPEPSQAFTEQADLCNGQRAQCSQGTQRDDSLDCPGPRPGGEWNHLRPAGEPAGEARQSANSDILQRPVVSHVGKRAGIQLLSTETETDRRDKVSLPSGLHVLRCHPNLRLLSSLLHSETKTSGYRSLGVRYRAGTERRRERSWPITPLVLAR